MPGGRLLGFSVDEIVELVSAPGDSERRDPVAVFAAGVWSCIVEPGDVVGGLVRGSLGFVGGLESLAFDDGTIRARLAQSGVDDADRVDIAGARARWEPRMVEQQIRSAFRSAHAKKVALVVPGDPEWPGGVDDLGPHGPAALWVRGAATALVDRASIAMVGSRASTAYGEQVASELASSLVERGVAVNSGGAYGIDGMVHRAALASGGSTVAVLAGGVDRLYPAGHHDLLTRVIERCAVISEVPCGSPPTRWRFLQRNRLLAAMTGATIVVEAGWRSGALNTASHARALGRPLGAVPGPISSPSSTGCHRLLKDADVRLVADGSDAFHLLDDRLDGTAEADEPEERRSAPELRVLDALTGRSARSEATVVASSGMAAGEVRATLALLELEGSVVERARGWIRVER